MKSCWSFVTLIAPARFMNLLVLSPALLISPPSMALTTVGPGQSLSINGSTPSDNYLVNGGGVLNTSGAQTFEVFVQSGSALNAIGGTFTGRNGLSGINVSNSQTTLTGATVTSDGAALWLTRQGSTTTGSTGVVSDSIIRGGTAGVLITGLSTLELNGGEVTGSLPYSVGIDYFGGEVRATGTTISGGENGARMAADGAGLGSTRLTLSGASLEGRAGSAILVEGGVEANVEVLNNSHLRAGNGTLLDVQGASTAAMTVANTSLLGNVNIDGNSTANLTFDQGRMTGDVVLVDDDSTATVTLQNNSQFTGRLDNVNGVTINSGSNWTLTGNDTIGTLAMNGGIVSFGAADAPGTFYQLNVGTLAGSATGTNVFVMKGNFATGERDFLNVTGVATGQFGLAVAASGLDAVSPIPLTLVHTAAGDAHFSLVGGAVDLGTWSYALASTTNGAGATDWYLDPTTKTVSPGARSVLALFNTATTIALAEDASLRSRMGELRFNGGQSGAWVRTYGNQYNVAAGSGVAYQQTQQGFSLGADARLGDSQWLLGVMAGYSKSDLNLDHGTSGTVDSYYVGPYVTWLDAVSGYYFDGGLKFNHFRNESKVGMSDGSRAKGDYDNSGVGGWAEFGRHIKFGNGYFIEPFTRVSAVVIQGKHYNLDNGMDADGDRARSLLGKVGSTFGRNFDVGNGKVIQPYVSAAMGYEFAKNNEVQVNNNVFNNDLSGARAEFGTGVAVAFSEVLQAHVDFDYEKGEYIEKPWGVNFGVRYSW
ncbi:autotransporter outer membrane beta-barrel domain-containing protein [Pseudomonas brassicacearum]|uniref:Autotransporter outer membrane beta-barrel domain-containing protein n=2 Tax=Pseudomonas brassicacearum TaxID=930166 RepID=A0A423JV03_9PSED|nr:autotransporter outer membrane beta-barrel domain-containing protein [Pseudomonas brassicacearum]